MPLNHKSFECQTNLSLDECETRIRDKYPPLAWYWYPPYIYLVDISREQDAISCTLKHMVMRGLAIRIAFTISSQGAITGNVRLSNIAVFMLSYFVVITFIIAIIFTSLSWISLFFWLIFASIAHMAVNVFRSHTDSISIVCNLLRD